MVDRALQGCRMQCLKVSVVYDWGASRPQAHSKRCMANSGVGRPQLWLRTVYQTICQEQPVRSSHCSRLQRNYAATDKAVIQPGALSGQKVRHDAVSTITLCPQQRNRLATFPVEQKELLEMILELKSHACLLLCLRATSSSVHLSQAT